jgi:hypothetical protein
MEYDRCVLDEIIMLFSLFCVKVLTHFGLSQDSLALGFLFTSRLTCFGLLVHIKTHLLWASCSHQVLTCFGLLVHIRCKKKFFKK